MIAPQPLNIKYGVLTWAPARSRQPLLVSQFLLAHQPAAGGNILLVFASCIAVCSRQTACLLI
jgi:hypothetical protein